MPSSSEPGGRVVAQDPRVARTHADVARAVRELFLEDGWDAITHQRVAERAGYGRNTIYRHFPDRTALLAQGGGYTEVHHAPITGDLRTDLIAELQAFRRELFEGIVGQIMAAIVERADRDPEIGPIRDRLVQAGAGQMMGLIRQAIAEGRMSAAVDVDDHTALLAGPILYARFCQAEPPSDEAIEFLVDNSLI